MSVAETTRDPFYGCRFARIAGVRAAIESGTLSARNDITTTQQRVRCAFDGVCDSRAGIRADEELSRDVRRDLVESDFFRIRRDSLTFENGQRSTAGVRNQ